MEKENNKEIINLIQERYGSLKEANILLIDKFEESKFIRKLFSISGYNVIKNIDNDFRVREGINFFSRELLYEKEEKCFKFIQNNESNIDILIFGLNELVNKLYSEENNVLKSLNKFKFKSILILNSSENFSMEELSYHYQYCNNELNIKNFFITDNINIKNRIINQYIDISNFIYENINEEFKKSFSLSQIVNWPLRSNYLEEEIIEIYKEILLDKREELKEVSIRNLYGTSKSIKEEFFKFYNIDKKNVEISKIVDEVIENILNNELMEVNSIRNNIEEIKENREENDEVIKGFLLKAIEVKDKVQIESYNDELDKTDVMEIDNTEVMHYRLLSELESDFKNIIKQKDEDKPNKKLSIINMNENKPFKEVTISEDYGINKDFTFEEDNNFTALIEIEEVDDKLKEIIWTNDEIAMEDLSDFELVKGSSKKYKKINMNGDNSN
ncbi:hypothetical protein [Clostridium sp.]|uniref:hypothetical protein n=1 Tax=Clostridium sp. TaxID=1506 RepID=UPI0039967914